MPKMKLKETELFCMADSDNYQDLYYKARQDLDGVKIKRKGVIIGAVIGVILVLFLMLFLMLLLRKPTVKITVEMIDENGELHIVEPSKPQNKMTPEEFYARQENEELVAGLLSKLDWVDMTIVTIVSDYSQISVILHTNREPSGEEIAAVVEIVLSNVNGLEKDMIFIIDGNGNPLFVG